MIIDPIAKRFAVLTSILVIGGAGMLWALSSGERAAQSKSDAPKVAEAPDKKDTNKNDTNKNDTNDKTEVKKKEELETEDDAAKAEKECAQVQIERLKGTWKVIYSEGELPAVKLPKGGKLQRPMFYLIDKDHLTWDNGKPDDPARLVRFHMRSNEQEIDITQNRAFPDWGWAISFDLDPLLSTADKSNAPPQFDEVYGMYAFVGERLRLCWSTTDRPWGLSTTRLWGKQNYSVVLQRVDLNDPQIAAKEKAAEVPDRQSLQGRWRITKVEGAQDPDIQVGHDFLFQGSSLKILWRNTDDIARPLAPLLLNARANPKQIAFFNDECPSANSGIYRLDKDRLEICWRIDHWRNPDEKQKEAPNKFEVGKDSKTIQMIQLERVDASVENTAAEKTRAFDLQKALVETLQARVNGLELRIQDGKESMNTIVDASEKLMEAQLSLAPDKKSHIQIMESYLQRLLRYEGICKQDFPAGNAIEEQLLLSKPTEQEVAQVKAKRLQTEILLEKEKGETAAKTRLLDLQKALVETLQAQVDGLEARVQAGKDTILVILDAAEQLMEAQLALAADKKSRIQVMEAHLHRLVEYEILYRREFFGGKSAPFEPERIKAKRLMAEIMLEKEK